MKLLICFIVTCSFSAFAEDPSAICDSSECSEPMRAISAAYKSGSINFLKAPLSAYSGECYHQDPQYDPNHAHYGVMVFEPSQNTFQMTGFFGFFFDSDPYANSTPREVLADLLLQQYYPIAGQITADSAEIALYFDSATVKYWIRSDEASQHVYLIGQWSGAGTSFWQTAMFCDLKSRE